MTTLEDVITHLKTRAWSG